ncbi:hypothetical protein MKEN_00766000 [Mycena kentingensis (nom. inval.)]|nr:hypothetical protein MKEN_00766000 [Mycena kentingensis (nom. inval.)]
MAEWWTADFDQFARLAHKDPFRPTGNCANCPCRKEASCRWAPTLAVITEDLETLHTVDLMFLENGSDDSCGAEDIIAARPLPIASPKRTRRELLNRAIHLMRRRVQL